jgi:hypothetical protein
MSEKAAVGNAVEMQWEMLVWLGINTPLCELSGSHTRVLRIPCVTKGGVNHHPFFPDRPIAFLYDNFAYFLIFSLRAV